jgi:signal peptidase II
MVVCDRLTKELASAHLRLHDPVPVVPGLNLTLSHNEGAAFSLLRDAGGWQRWAFIAVALIAVALIVGWLRRLPAANGWLACALALILSGALGNLWDRVALGYVVDFIDVYYRQWHWPVFNVADSAVSVGAVMLVIDSLRPLSSRT